MRIDDQTTGSAKGPVLVTGMPRSGTSLLAGILRNHPSLAIPKVESTWWTRIYPRYRGVRDPVQWDRFLNELFRMRATHREPAKWSMSAGVKTPVAVIQATMFGVLRLVRRLAPGSTERQAALLPNGEKSLSN